MAILHEHKLTITYDAEGVKVMDAVRNRLKEQGISYTEKTSTVGTTYIWTEIMSEVKNEVP